MQKTIIGALSVLLFSVVACAEQATYHHVHLRADDTAAAAQWYADHFGGEAGRMVVFDVTQFDGVTLIFYPKEQPGVDGTPHPGALEGSRGSALDHIGWDVPDVAAKVAELEAKGVEVVSRPADSGGLFTYAFVRDPWGTVIELTDIVKDGKFSHVHVVSADPERTINWYADYFGGEVVHPMDVPTLWAIQYGQVVLVATQRPGRLAPTMHRSADHLGWSFTDLAAAVERMKAGGVKVVKDVYRFGPTNIAFVESPEGVLIECIQIPFAYPEEVDEFPVESSRQ